MANFEAVHRYLATVEEAEKHPYKPCFTVSTISVMMLLLRCSHRVISLCTRKSNTYVYDMKINLNRRGIPCKHVF